MKRRFTTEHTDDTEKIQQENQDIPSQVQVSMPDLVRVIRVFRGSLFSRVVFPPR